MLLREVIGAALRRARTARRRTLREVSRRARVSLGYLSEVERGRKEPSSELLAAICAALEVELPDLLADAAVDMAEAMARAAGGSRRRLIGLEHADLRVAGADTGPIGAGPAPLVLPVGPADAPAAPVARVAA